MMDSIAAYGLGGSAMALFGRVGGGIYTKAADVGADLVGKVEQDLPEDSPKNPATIADNVGDNVGDVAGMGSDLFGSFAEASSAALAISATFQYFQNSDSAPALLFPIMLSSLGIASCFLTSFFATDLMTVDHPRKIESTLKWQIIISTLILTGTIYLASYISLPYQFDIRTNTVETSQIKYRWQAYICAISGLWAGLIIGWFTEFMTSHQYKPVRDVAQSTTTGAATNIIYGLALGYLSTIIPVISLALSAYISIKLLGMYGVALAALGMLSNLAITLAVDGYGPISDNAGGIAEMSDLGHEVRERTDALDAAGNTTAAIGKGFAIGSAALVSLALYGGFITRANDLSMQKNYQHLLIMLQGQIIIQEPMVFAGLIIGAMLPYAFSALTMKAVGHAALDMVKEVRRQLKDNPNIIIGQAKPDYKACVKISTEASLKKMIAPGALVIFTPLIIGFIFGPLAIAGLLPGALISGVQMAISMSNTGGAWDNAKKYIESGQLKVDEEVKGKGSNEHKAAVIGDTVGDPLKDTSGPSLNILMKLMAIISLVFTKFYLQTGFLAVPLNENSRQVKI